MKSAEDEKFARETSDRRSKPAGRFRPLPLMLRVGSAYRVWIWRSTLATSMQIDSNKAFRGPQFRETLVGRGKCGVIQLGIFDTFCWSDYLELAFHSRDLRDLCEKRSYAIDVYGERVAGRLRHRLADMAAAKSPRDLPSGNCRVSSHDNVCMNIDLCDGFEIEFCANHVSNPTEPDGNIAWQRVSRIKILKIGRGDARACH